MATTTSPELNKCCDLLLEFVTQNVTIQNAANDYAYNRMVADGQVTQEEIDSGEMSDRLLNIHSNYMVRFYRSLAYHTFDG